AHARRGLGRVKADVLATLRVAAYQVLFLDRIPAHAAVNDAAAAVTRRGPPVVAFVNGILRSLVRTGEPTLPTPADEPAACTAWHAMPEPLVVELARSLDAPAELFAA